MYYFIDINLPFKSFLNWHICEGCASLKWLPGKEYIHIQRTPVEFQFYCAIENVHEPIVLLSRDIYPV